ncbi:hypothetical protein ACQEUU_19630 [Nonomuraea sp. CA-218870]|uniref:hypothetical protein n=1 Tax=Nonomuraea sp. CA-218870 TaxID=3239998 RepID=UPI003D8F31E4
MSSTATLSGISSSASPRPTSCKPSGRLEAAIKAGARIIVTSNIKDFPAEELTTWDMEAQSPDDFILDQIELDDRIVWACVQQIVDSRVNPPATIRDVLSALERAGLVESVAPLRSGRFGA